MNAPSTSAATRPSKVESRSLPIEVLDTDVARLFTHIHPILVLALYSLSFRRIVADPTPALFSCLLLVAPIQITYIVLCLPPYGKTAAQSPSKPGLRKKHAAGKADAGAKGRIVPALLSLLLTAILGTPLIAIVLILFGAPLTTHLPHTLLCAAHISLLAALPLIYVYGVDSRKWREIAGLMLPVDEVFGATLGTLLGAWVGAVPIPLDWDRDWQKWPITIVTGAYVGFSVGKLAGGYLLKGKTIKFD